jgi:DUF4097 and DUF4098 domain-containing protein YvlB
MNAAYRTGLVASVMFGFSLSLPTVASAQEVGQISYQMGRKAIISITNSYGPITVKGSDGKVVSVTYTSYAKSVAFDNERHGNRLSLVSVSEHLGDNLAEYSLLAPRHAFLSLFAHGPIHVEGLAGDITIQTTGHAVEIKNLNDAYINVKTLDGPVTLTALRNCHVYIHSIDGPINISDAPGSSVEANSTGGRITYDGDPGSNGDYRLSSHSGDVDVSIPASALVEVQTNGHSGQKPDESTTGMTRRNSLFLSPTSVSRAHFELRSFIGKVRLKRPRTALR